MATLAELQAIHVLVGLRLHCKDLEWRTLTDLATVLSLLAGILLRQGDFSHVAGQRQGGQVPTVTLAGIIPALRRIGEQGDVMPLTEVHSQVHEAHRAVGEALEVLG